MSQDANKIPSKLPTNASTPQEVFDFVAAHLLKQNEMSVHQRGHTGGCRYRSPDMERSCAVGCLIPDEAYGEWMEGCTISTLINRVNDKRDQVMGSQPIAKDYEEVLRNLFLTLTAHRNLLNGLQDVHDSGKPECWAQALEKFAKTYYLDNLKFNKATAGANTPPSV